MKAVVKGRFWRNIFDIIELSEGCIVFLDNLIESRFPTTRMKTDCGGFPYKMDRRRVLI